MLHEEKRLLVMLHVLNIIHGSVIFMHLSKPRQLNSISLIMQQVHGIQTVLQYLHLQNFLHITMSSEEAAPVQLCIVFLMVTDCSMLTFYAATARLQHPGVHVCLGVGEELVSSQVCVMRGGDEVVTQRLLHVLIHLIVQRVEDVTRWTAHEAGETCC